MQRTNNDLTDDQILAVLGEFKDCPLCAYGGMWQGGFRPYELAAVRELLKKLDAIQITESASAPS